MFRANKASKARQGSASFGPGFGASGDLEAATSAAKALLSDRAQAVARVATRQEWS